MVRYLVLNNALKRLTLLACSALALLFVVTGYARAQAYQLAFTTNPPLPTNLALNTTLSGAQITIETSSGIKVSSSDTIKIKIVGPGGYAAGPFTVSAIGGVANISFKNVTFASDGLYTLTATDVTTPTLLPANQVAGVDQALLPQHQLTSQSSSANPSANAIYSGIFYNPYGPNIGPNPKDDPAPLETDVNRITKPFATDMHYISWNDMSTPPLPDVTQLLNKYIGYPTQTNGPDFDILNNRIPIISWGCDINDTYGDRSTNQSIALSKEDTNVIIPTADLLKGYGGPIFVRWQWEMNNQEFLKCLGPLVNGSNPEAQQEADFIAAWQHIVGVFQSRGVTNVIWLWNPLANGSSDINNWYPGDPYVDWTGTDTYANDDITYEEWENSFFPSIYAALSPHDKPILMAETGAHDGQGCKVDGHSTDNILDQGAFFLDGIQSLSQGFPTSTNPKGYPDIMGVSYFDSPNGSDTCDWEIVENTPPPANLTDFETFYQAPYMLATNVPKTSYPYYTMNGIPGVAYDKYIHFVVNPVQISSGSPIPLWVTVDSLDGLTAPNAGVTVYLGSNNTATLTLLSCDAGISCTYTGSLPNITTGQHSLIAEYAGDSGDSVNPKGQSGPINITIQ